MPDTVGGVPHAGRTSRLPSGRLLAFTCLACAATLLFLPARTGPSKSMRHAIPLPGQIPAVDASIPPTQSKIVSGTIRPGDTLASLLSQHLSAEEIEQVARSSRKVFHPRKIRAGNAYHILLESDAFDRLVYEIDEDEQLVIQKEGDSFEITREEIPYAVQAVVVRGEVSTSLFAAMEAAGEDPELATRLAEIFAWEVDFLRNLQKGDSFRMLVEKRFRDGRPCGYGRILAAEFKNDRETWQAVLYEGSNGRSAYYSPEGKSLRKAFLKAPLNYTRISSGYAKTRLHPITRTWKPHPAIDYAAPAGTPVNAVADGTVLEAARNPFNGNYVKIRHANGYQTLYLHLSRFDKGIRKGSSVAQGQVIGFVGATGLATGPHLCFRITRNGKPVDPRRLDSASLSAFSPRDLARFKTRAKALLARLDDKPAGPRGAAKVASRTP